MNELPQTARSGGLDAVDRLDIAGLTRWWWAIAKRHWFRDEYRPALDAFRQAFVEQLWLSHLQMAYTLPLLDRTDEAKAHVASILRLSPGFTVRDADAYYSMWCFSPPYREKMRDALRTAGLPE